MLGLIDRLADAGVSVSRLDLDGGLVVRYDEGEEPPSIAAYGARLTERLSGRDLELQIEPGRSIVGAAGVLLTQTLYVKHNDGKRFVVVDAAMNDLIRPALYQSHHEIVPVIDHGRGTVRSDVVGPVCESGDFLAKDRDMANVHPGELLAVATAGAYGFALSSNYNSRPRSAEVLVDKDEFRIVRRRETYEDLIRGEEV